MDHSLRPQRRRTRVASVAESFGQELHCKDCGAEVGGLLPNDLQDRGYMASDPDGLQLHTLAHLHSQLMFCTGDGVEKCTESPANRNT